VKPDSATATPSRPSPGAAGVRLAALYEDHARMVLGVCRLMLRDADEAEDATQQVFLSAYRSLLAGTEPRNPGAWLGTIARNEARNRIATRQLRPIGLAAGLEPVSVSLEEQAGARAELAELQEELSALPEKQREAVVLRDLFGLRYDEVARALGVTRPAVEALLFRGRRRLQRRLRPEIAAGVLVVPLALRESLAYAIPGFAAGGAQTAGVLAKLAAVPLAAKLAAAGATVGVAGSAGVVAERELKEPPRKPAAALVQRVTKPPPSVVQSVVGLPQLATRGVERAEAEVEKVLWDAREDTEDRDEPEDNDEVKDTDEAEDRGEPDETDEPEEIDEPESGVEHPLFTRDEVEPDEDEEEVDGGGDSDDSDDWNGGSGIEADAE